MQNGFEKRAPPKKEILFEKFLIPPLKSFFKKKKIIPVCLNEPITLHTHLAHPQKQKNSAQKKKVLPNKFDLLT